MLGRRTSSRTARLRTSQPVHLRISSRITILVAPLSSNNLPTSDKHPRGLTVPTLLTGQLYNNRSIGQQLTAAFGTNATGQVVYFQPQLAGSTTKRKRQGVGTDSAQLQAGLTETANITALDISWSRGYIQMVDS